MKIYEGLEMGVADWPLRWREVLLVVVESESAIYRLFGVCALAEDEEYLLVDLWEY